MGISNKKSGPTDFSVAMNSPHVHQPVGLRIWSPVLCPACLWCASLSGQHFRNNYCTKDAHLKDDQAGGLDQSRLSGGGDISTRI